MKIQIKNLGPLEEAEFSLGDMTIICGENNTGKTYATYALFGFLTFWREKYSVSVRDEDINRLFREGVVHLDLTKYTAEADGILEVGCDQYREQLPMVFAAPAPRFQDTEFQVRLDPGDIQLVDTYERRISSANAERLSITKSEGSSDLVITLLVEKEKIRLPHAIVGQIVGSAIKDVIFGRVFPNPFIASAERTGAAIFRKELNFARTVCLKK